jgi:hypothetical protein
MGVHVTILILLEHQPALSCAKIAEVRIREVLRTAT